MCRPPRPKQEIKRSRYIRVSSTDNAMDGLLTVGTFVSQLFSRLDKSKFFHISELTPDKCRDLKNVVTGLSLVEAASGIGGGKPEQSRAHAGLMGTVATCLICKKKKKE